MSGLNLSQNILGLSAGANFGDIADIGAQASLDFRATAELKRGIELQIGVGALAELEAGFHKFLAADVQVRGEAKAQLKGQIQAPLDLFSESGVAVRLQAIAQLSLSARLAVGLSIGDFLALAHEDPRIRGVYLRLLEIFLEELEIQAGVQGRVAFSAMAYLNLVIAGRLIEDQETGLPAGFTISADCGAGLEGGGGWEFFANLGLKNPRRFIRRSVDVMVDEMVQEIREELPDRESRELVGLLRAPAKMALRGGFEIGLALAENSPSFADTGPELAQQCVQVVLEEAQRFLLEQITILAIKLIKEGLEGIGAGADAWDNSKDERQFLGNQLGDMPDDPFDLSPESVDYWSGVINGAVGLGLELSGDLIPDELKEPLALLWAAVQLAFVTTQRVTDATARASFFGAFTAEQRIEAFKGQLVDQAPAPDVIKHFINAKLGRGQNDTLLQEHLVEFLTDTAIEQLIEQMPEAKPFLEIIAGEDAPPDALSAAANTILTNAGAFVPTGNNGEMDPEASLRALAKGLEAYIDTRIKQELTPLIYQAVGDKPEIRLYVDDVLLPSMDFIVEVVFDKVLNWSFGNVGYRDALRDACSSIVMKVVGRSLVVTTDILMAHTATYASEELRNMAEQVDDDGGFGDQLADAAGADRELVGEVLHESLLICADVFGPMPDNTRTKIRNLLYIIIDSVPPNPDAKWVDQLQQDLFIPNDKVRNALVELGNELGSALGGYLQEFYTRVLTRVAEIILEETGELVDQLVEAAEEWINELVATVTALAARILELPGEIMAALNRVTEIFDQALADVIGLLASLTDSSSVLENGLSQALYSQAFGELIDNNTYKKLNATLSNLATEALEETVSTLVKTDLLKPITDVYETIAVNQPAILLEAMVEELAELRDLDPAANVVEKVQEIFLDHIESAIRDSFGGQDPSLPIALSISYQTPAIGFPGTFAYMPPKTFSASINLGSVSLPLDTIVDIARAALAGLPLIVQITQELATTLINYFAAQDDKEALEIELVVANQQQALLEEQLEDTHSGATSTTILDPVPGGIYERDLEIDIHISNAHASYLGLGELGQPRIFILLNQEILTLDRFSYEIVEDKTVSKAPVKKNNNAGKYTGTKTLPVTPYLSKGSEKVSQSVGIARYNSLQKKLSPPTDYLRLPLDDIGQVPTRSTRNTDADSIGAGLRLQLRLNFATLRQGINTLTVIVTNGYGATEQQVVPFVMTESEPVDDEKPLLIEKPRWEFDGLPAEVIGWFGLEESKDGKQKENIKKKADRQRPSNNKSGSMFWLDSRNTRKQTMTKMLNNEQGLMLRKTKNLRRAKAILVDGSIKPVNVKESKDKNNCTGKKTLKISKRPTGQKTNKDERKSS